MQADYAKLKIEFDDVEQDATDKIQDLGAEICFYDKKN